jgi:hypothetical protein
MKLQPVIWVLWTLLFRGVRLIDQHPREYELKRFNNSSGIYYENLGKTVLYSTDWKVVVYLPLGATRSQLATLEGYVKYVEQFCARIDLKSWTARNHLDDLTSNRLGQARDTEQLIAKIVGRDDDKHRRKRGLFYFVGKVSKVIF